MTLPFRGPFTTKGNGLVGSYTSVCQFKGQSSCREISAIFSRLFLKINLYVRYSRQAFAM